MRRVRGETTCSVNDAEKIEYPCIRIQFLLHILEKKIRKYIVSFKKDNYFLRLRKNFLNKSRVKAVRKISKFYFTKFKKYVNKDTPKPSEKGQRD